jgi:hypothetical protein
MLTADPSSPEPEEEYRGLGPVEWRRWSQLRWPSPFVPAFTLALERRWVHRFSLRLRYPGLRRLSLEIALVEPNPTPRATNMLLPSYDDFPLAWTSARVRLSDTMHLDLARSFVLSGRALASPSFVPIGQPRLGLTLTPSSAKHR